MHRPLAAALALLLAHAAHAGRPLQSEDADLLAPARCEAETALTRLDSRRGQPKDDSGYAQLACAVDGRTQLALALGLAHGQAPAATALAAGKTALRPLTAEQAGVVLAYSVLGSRPREEGLRLAGGSARLALTVPHGAWLLHANAGVLHDHDSRRNTTLWTLAVERTALGAFDLMAEAFGDDRDRTAWLNAGLRWRVPDARLSLDAAYAVQTGGARARLATAGLKLLF